MDHSGIDREADKTRIMGTSARDFFSLQQQAAVTRAITAAEHDTSGEIRVHIENSFKGGVLDRAAYIFRHLGMARTRHRNGILIYLAIKNKQFAIIGDKGIHKEVPENFWTHLHQEMLVYFRENRFDEGLIFAISETGKQLQKHFPRQAVDRNELPDEISFGND
jgi:uncharacterized membrane protein